MSDVRKRIEEAAKENNTCELHTFPAVYTESRDMVSGLNEIITIISELDERIKTLEERNPPLEITDDRIKEMFERAERGECVCGCHVSKDKEDFKDGCDICKINH